MYKILLFSSELQFSNGNDYLPWILLASFSSLLKDYLKFIDTSTILEPSIVVPDLEYEEFLIFKKYLMSPNISFVYQKSDISTLTKVFKQFGIEVEIFEIFHKEDHQKPKKVF